MVMINCYGPKKTFQNITQRIGILSIFIPLPKRKKNNNKLHTSWIYLPPAKRKHDEQKNQDLPG